MESADTLAEMDKETAAAAYKGFEVDSDTPAALAEKPEWDPKRRPMAEDCKLAVGRVGMGVE